MQFTPFPWRCSISWRLCAAAGLLYAQPLFAAEIALTAEGATQLALTQNLELRAARELVAEATARGENAGRLPNPELATEFAGGRNFDGRVEIGVTQRFPLTARLRLARSLSALEVELARLEVAAHESRLAEDVQRAFFELAAAREGLVLSAQQVRLAERVAETQATQAREGAGSPLDANQSRLAVREQQLQLATACIEESEAVARLATLVGTSAGTAFNLHASLDLPADIPGEQTVGRRADIRLAQLAVEAGDAGIALARTARWEDIGVGVFVEGDRERDELGRRERDAFLGVRVSMPLPLWQKGDAPVAEKRASRDRFARQLEALTLAADNEAHAAFRAMASRHETARTIGADLVPAARQHLAETEAAFARGEIDSQPLFLARERLASFERNALEARKIFHLARIHWLAATGNLIIQP
jgi:cobalt-zinc-cadmium efflux system outer membrane protein